jgi:hypothetical protein
MLINATGDVMPVNAWSASGVCVLCLTPFGALSACAGPADRGTDPTTAPDCQVSPLSYAQYTTEAELETLLIGRWQRCKARQIAGEDVGVEFTADGRYWALTWNASHQVVRQVGIDYGGTWVYYPPGSTDPISNQPSTKGFFDLSGVLTDPPTFTNDPRQLRVLFSPVLSIYVPLTAG